MVIATNPLRKLLYAKEKHRQQTWFRHEWVPGKEVTDGEGETERPGISKFYDGFKVENPKLLRTMMGDRRLVNGVLTVTIFEEGTGVTAVAWNPNQVCAGWACAGLGCGLLRVEDLAT
jgi:transcription factor C subunit 6